MPPRLSVGLAGLVEDRGAGLAMKVEPRGENLSVGQRVSWATPLYTRHHLTRRPTILSKLSRHPTAFSQKSHTRTPPPIRRRSTAHPSYSPTQLGPITLP
jgi:hypothetical protein